MSERDAKILADGIMALKVMIDQHQKSLEAIKEFCESITVALEAMEKRIEKLERKR